MEKEAEYRRRRSYKRKPEMYKIRKGANEETRGSQSNIYFSLSDLAEPQLQPLSLQRSQQETPNHN